MKKTFTLFLVLCAVILSVNAQKKKIGYYSLLKTTSWDPTAASSYTDPVIQMLQADTANFIVTPNILTDQTATATADISVYDLIVIQESFSGSAGILTPSGALGLAKLNKPCLYNKAYAFKAGRAFATGAAGTGSETAGSSTVNLVCIHVDAANQTNDLFKGITFVGDSVSLLKVEADDNGFSPPTTNYKAINYATSVVLSNTTTLLAKPNTVKTADQSILTVSFNDIPSGTTLGGELLAARMITFGMNFGALCTDGGTNLTAAGLTLYRNAIYSLAGLTVPTSPVNQITALTITGGSITTKGGTLQLSATYTPTDATFKVLKWKVDNSSFATIDSTKGILTAVANGTVTVTAYANDGSGVSGTTTITISGQTPAVLVTGIAVAGEGGATTIATKGGTLQMHANVSPDNANDTTFAWSVNNTAIATIDASGLLTAVTDGKVAVKATAHDASGIVGIDTITVSNQITLVTGIAVAGKANATTITTKGGTLQMQANVSPDNANDTTVAWSVDKATVASISTTTGLLTAVANGTVVVTATAHDGSGIKGTATITVSGQNVGIANVNAKQFSVYPIPAQNVLNITNAVSQKIEILNMQGKVLISVKVTGDINQVNISNLKPGVYMVRNGDKVTKFVKE
jgi:uncharacterized protein YjdB